VRISLSIEVFLLKTSLLPGGGTSGTGATPDLALRGDRKVNIHE